MNTRCHAETPEQLHSRSSIAERMAPSISFFDYLPNEVFLDILLRVPAVSLQRLRGVCRRWRAIIDRKRFVDAQHERALMEYPSIVMFLERNRAPCALDAVLVLPDSEAVREAAPPVAGGEGTEIEVLGHVGGSSWTNDECASPRICFSIWRMPGFEWDCGMPWYADIGCNLMCYRSDEDYYDVVLILLNPITQKKVELPPCPYFHHDWYNKEFSYWVGLDAVSGFHKVVVVSHGYRKPIGIIYTVNKDRSWRLLDKKVRDRLLGLASGWLGENSIRTYRDPTYYKGRLFWPLISRKIVAFDFTTEKLQHFDTPGKAGHLFVLGKSTSRTLAKVSCVGDSTSDVDTYRVWVLEEGSESEKLVWTPWDRGDVKIPKELWGIKFISSLSKDNLLVEGFNLRDVLHEKCKKHSSGKCDAESRLACYNIVDGTFSCLESHLPSVMGKDYKLCQHFLLHPSLAFPTRKNKKVDKH